MLEGFGGVWVPGYYAVKIADSTDNEATYEIASQLAMSRTEVYSICDDNSGICGGAWPQASDAGSLAGRAGHLRRGGRPPISQQCHTIAIGDDRERASPGGDRDS